MQSASHQQHKRYRCMPCGEAAGLDALLAAIVSTANYHEATTSLAGQWIAQGKPLADALVLIQAAFRMVPEAQRDARWRQRYDDVGRCVNDLYRKHLRAEGPPPQLSEPAGLLDTRRYALAALRKAQNRIATALAGEREALVRVEARGLARFVRNELLTDHEARTALLQVAVNAGVSLDTVQTILSAILGEGGDT